MSYEINISCNIDLNGKQQKVDGQVKQEYDSESSNISLDFEWSDPIVGETLIVASDSGIATSIQTSTMLTYTNITRNITNGVASATKIITTAKSLDLYHEVLPSASQLVDICFYLSNFPKFARISNFQINIKGFVVDFITISNDRNNRKAIVSGVEFSRIQEVTDLINDCCWLCSFAGGCLVGLPRLEVYNNGNLILTKLQNIDTSMADIGNHVVHDKMSSSVLKSFLENSIIPFQSIRTDYRLNALIHVGLLANNNPYLQVKALLMADFLEILRYNFASNIGIRTGIFTQNNINFCWCPSGRRAYFEDILVRFCTDIGLTGWNTDFKNIRNEIMHSGDINPPNKLARYRELHHFCDKVILALLEWDSSGGTYVPFNNTMNSGNNHVSVNRIPFNR